jgi:hypothetical protein
MSNNQTSIIDSLNQDHQDCADCAEMPVEKKMTADEEIAYAKEAIENAPETYLDAVKRIMEVEMRLEDLARSAEIAEITGQYNLMEGFRKSADESLEKKITIKREATGDMNLTVVTGKLDPASLNQGQQPQAL